MNFKRLVSHLVKRAFNTFKVNPDPKHLPGEKT